MKERYLFRGKRVDNGEWADGALYKNKYILGDLESRGWHGVKDILSIEFVEVDPATVGQCTELHDKNGTMIFEGDIIETHSGLIGDIRFGTFFDVEDMFHEYGWYWDGKDDDGDGIEFALSPAWEGHKIIGNIHDTPELMEVHNG